MDYLISLAQTINERNQRIAGERTELEGIVRERLDEMEAKLKRISKRKRGLDGKIKTKNTFTGNPLGESISLTSTEMSLASHGSDAMGVGEVVYQHDLSVFERPEEARVISTQQWVTSNMEEDDLESLEDYGDDENRGLGQGGSSSGPKITTRNNSANMSRENHHPEINRNYASNDRAVLNCTPGNPTINAETTPTRKSSRPSRVPTRYESLRISQHPHKQKERQEPSESTEPDSRGEGQPRRKRRRGNSTLRARPERPMAMSDGKRRVLDAEWPIRGRNTIRGIAQVVGCTICQASVHYACAGIDVNDEETAEEWVCPDCLYLQKHNLSGIPSSCPGRCARYNCVLRLKKAVEREEDDDKEYVVERIIGKRRINATEKKFEYLIQWENWSISDSTWEPPENLHSHFSNANFEFLSDTNELGLDSQLRGGKDIVLLPAAAEVFGLDGKLKEGVKGWSRDVESVEPV